MVGPLISGTVYNFLKKNLRQSTLQYWKRKRDLTEWLPDKQCSRNEGRGPDPNKGTRKHRTAEHKLTADYLLRDLKQRLCSIRRDGEKSREGIETCEERQVGWHMLHRMEWNGIS